MASVALLTVTGILSQAVGFAYRVGLTRLAGAEIMGLYQLILPVYSILLSLTSVGLTTGVSNLSAWYQALGDRRAIWQVRGQAIRLFFLLAALPCILLLLFSDAVSVYLLGDARTRLGLMLLVPCLLLTGELAEALLLRDRTGLPGGHDGIGRDGPAGCLGPLAGQGPLPCHGGGRSRGHRPGHGPV